MRKSLWSPDEDEKLKQYVTQHGCGNWSDVAKNAGLQRCGKSCRLRWINYLRPNLKRGPFSKEEIKLILNLHRNFGNSWSKMATYLPGRTDNDIKNFWHSYTRSSTRLGQQGGRQKSEQAKDLMLDKDADQCNMVQLAASEMLLNVDSAIISESPLSPHAVEATIKLRNVQADAMDVCTQHGFPDTTDASGSGLHDFSYTDPEAACEFILHNEKQKYLDDNPPEGLQAVVWSFLNRQLPPCDQLHVESGKPMITPQIIDEFCRDYDLSFNDVQANLLTSF